MRKVFAHKPDVAVVDIRMPPTNTDDGLRAAVEIRRRMPETGVLVLSQYLEAGYALELLGRQRRKGRLPAQGPGGGHRALRRCGSPRGHGGSALDPEVVARLVSRGRSAGDPLERLTPREHEVVALMAEGRSNRAIAERARGDRARGREARDRDLRQARSGAGRSTTTGGCWRCSRSCGEEPRRAEAASARRRERADDTSARAGERSQAAPPALAPTDESTPETHRCTRRSRPAGRRAPRAAWRSRSPRPQRTGRRAVASTLLLEVRHVGGNPAEAVELSERPLGAPAAPRGHGAQRW